jgi:hypothetical protein
MKRIRLIHWKAGEAEERAGWLQALGYQVEAELPAGPAFFRTLRQDPPDAVVIDLERLPSQGRDMGLTLRKYQDTRHVPLVYVGGLAAKVDRIKELIPDAAYTTWDRIGPVLEDAIAHPPQDPVVPGSLFDAYAGTPLPKKLGIKAGAAVGLVGAPEGLPATLGALPEGATLHDGIEDPRDLILWFVRDRDELDGGLPTMVTAAQRCPVWIAWPKKASGVTTDLSQQVVRQTGLAAGLVDYKICAVDKTWSALLFTQRK